MTVLSTEMLPAPLMTEMPPPLVDEALLTHVQFCKSNVSPKVCKAMPPPLPPALLPEIVESRNANVPPVTGPCHRIAPPVPAPEVTLFELNVDRSTVNFPPAIELNKMAPPPVAVVLPEKLLSAMERVPAAKTEMAPPALA